MTCSDDRFYQAQTAQGLCWVQAPDAEAVEGILRLAYGRSAGDVRLVRGDREQPLSRATPPPAVYLASDGTWRQQDGKPYLGHEASAVLAFGATYEEAAAYAAGDQTAGRFFERRRAAMHAERERAAAEQRAKRGW